MKLYTSYWAMVRYFPSNLVVLSTVVWPPKWYQLGSVDKNGVISLSCSPLKPGKSCEGLCRGPEHCSNIAPNKCSFLQAYRKQLDEINFHEFMEKLLDLRARLCEDFHVDDLDFAFIVYEKYDNPCSERVTIQQWFRDNGVPIEEWQRIKS